MRVDVPVLRGLGGAVQREGEELRRNVDAVGVTLSPVGGPGVVGWASVVVLAAAGQGWRDFLAGLSQRTTVAGQALVASADNYQAADERSVARQRGLARYE